MSGRRLRFARLFGSAVFSQALLSAASFAVGLLLIRRSDDHQYGWFILASNAIVLVVSLQNAFFGPALAARIGHLDAGGRALLVGGLRRGQRQLLAWGAPLLVLGCAALWWTGRLDGQGGPLVLVAIVAAVAVLQRELFRLVLLALRRAGEVLVGDTGYVALLLAGVFVATLTPWPALGAVATLGLAAAAGAALLAAALARHEPSVDPGTSHLLREVAPGAAWSTAGAAVHWTFSQGYVYLVAATLDLRAVAAIAATRLLLMPVNLLSSGIGSLMLPLASAWLHHHGAARVQRRLAGFALALAGAALAYFAIVWFARDEVFDLVLRRRFEGRDALLALWGLLFLVMIVRDQLGFLPAAQGRFRAMTTLTLACAAVSLAASYAGMRHFGAPGALAGMLAGEGLSLAGMVWLARRGATPSVPLSQPA